MTAAKEFTRELTSQGIERLKYEIREIIAVAKQIESLGMKISWENIGDPVAKGEKLPGWLKQIIKKACSEDKNYAYSPSKGIDETREFLARKNNKRGGVQITKEDIIFFNGLGDAIGKLYLVLDQKVRVIGPSPAYPTHSSFEAFHADSAPLTYNLDPKNNWYPDLDDLREKIKNDSNIAGILVISPNNPTGTVYPREVMEEIVRIAKENNLFIICDEIYSELTYNGKHHTYISSIIGEVCCISLKGISKEFPWPGGRCGWAEVYNAGNSQTFRKYAGALFKYKLLEVCSTTLPQKIIPAVMAHPKYEAHIRKRNKFFQKRAAQVYSALKKTNELIINRPDGAFYMTVVFKEGILKNSQTLKLENPKIKEYVEGLADKDIPLDRRFAYYLLGAAGICVVPLTGFNCQKLGFRMVLLEHDSEKFKKTLATLKEKIAEYVSSA